MTRRSHERIGLMRKGTRRVLGAGVLAGLGYAVWRAWRARVPEQQRGVEWQSSPFPFPPVPRPPQVHVPPEVEPGGGPETEVAGEAHVPAWLEANGDGSCPATHPVKAKMGSGIFHVPGGANYDRTNPDRCYVDAAAAEADGLRQSKV
jgi:hypothetical protein